MLFCEVCQTEVIEDSKDWLACYCIGYPKNDVENHPAFWVRRPTQDAPDLTWAAEQEAYKAGLGVSEWKAFMPKPPSG